LDHTGISRDDLDHLRVDFSVAVLTISSGPSKLEFMKYSSVQITFQEVPNEISLCFLVTGCPLRCPGCHSADSWNASIGTDLTIPHLENLLDQCRSTITCVCFLGGEWQEKRFLELCRWSQGQGLKTCLYTGLEDVNAELKSVLDFLKVGPYLKDKGGLSSQTTNQRFINVKTNEILNHHFIDAQGGLHDSTQSHTNRK
jgi:anaerobic ribonucleoside-triphosphate reductase activating protein